MVWSTLQSLDSDYSLVETPETVDDWSLVPLKCVWVSHCFCIVSQGAPSCHIYHNSRVFSLAYLRVLSGPVWCSTIVAVSCRLILVSVEV